MRKVFAAIGVSDLKTYLQKYFLPVFLLDFLILFVFLFAFKDSSYKYVGAIIFFLVLGGLFLYPYILLDRQSKDIEQNLHYFITYAGALSTVNLERKELFRDLSEKVRYREISKIFKKILYLVESIKIDFSTACYKVANIIKTKHFSRFLERMGIALSFDSDVSKFFLDEQKAIMDSYEVIYREGLERIKLVEEIFVSLILAFAFVLATVMLLPFMTGVSGVFFLRLGILFIIVLDIAIIVFINYFLPRDKLYHNLGYDEGRKRVLILFMISMVIVIILTPIFITNTYLNFMLRVAIILTPLLVVGLYSNYEEKKVIKREQLFPPFIRSLGDVHQAKGGTLTSTIETLLPHNFGILNDMLERVFKRLKITADKFNSWYYFAKESGSALINEFIDIFVSVVYRGGSAQKAGEIISDNMSRINGLRDQRKEFVSTLKGSVYGTFFGLALTLYISLMVSVLLFKIFSSLTQGISGMALELISGVLPSGLEDNFKIANYYVGVILVIHAFLSALAVKQTDGGNYFSLFTDFVIMVWIGAIIEIVLTIMFKAMFSMYFA